MKINLRKEHYSLEEFLFGEVNQGLVSFQHRFSDPERDGMKMADIVLFLQKIYEEKTEFSGITIMGSYVDLESNYEENVIGSDTPEFLFSINKEKKCIIYSEHPKQPVNVYMELQKLKLDHGYMYLGKNKLNNHYEKDQIRRIRIKIKERIHGREDLIDSYMEEYNKSLLERKNLVRRDYLTDPSMEDYKSYFRVENVVYENLKNLQKYALSEEFRDETAEDNVEFNDRVIKYIAEIDAKNTLLDMFRENNDDSMQLSLEIRESIKKGGKSLQLILKDGKDVRVENFLYRGAEFRTLVGRENIKIEEIKEIRFNSKIIFHNGL